MVRNSLIEPNLGVCISNWLCNPCCFYAFTGVYPLFRRSASDLQGAALRVHITGIVTEEDSDVAASQMNPDSEGEPFSEEVDIFPEDMKLLSDDAEEDQTPLPITPKKTGRKHNHKSSRATPDITAVPHTPVNEDESFPVTIAVDQAMHLNLSGEFTHYGVILSFFKSILQ